MSNYAVILKRNVVANLIRYFIVFAIAFYLTPVVVGALGDSGYGVWVLVYSFIGYAGIFEMGIMPATVKLISQFASPEMVAQRNAVANTAIVFYVGLGTITCILFWTAFIPIMYSMVGESLDLDELTVFSRIVGLDAFVSFATYPFMGIAYGMHQYHRQSQRDIFVGIANLLGSVTVLHFGWGLLGLACVKLGSSVLGFVVLVIMCRDSFSRISFSLNCITRSALKDLLRLGFSLFIVQTLTRVNNYAIPVLITVYRNAAMTAYFSVAQTLVGRLLELLWSASAPFMPVFSEISSAKEKEAEAEGRLKSIYIRGSRLIIACSIPLYLLLFSLGPSFLGAWVGSTYTNHAGLPMRILVLEMVVIGFQPLLERMMVGQGQMRTYILALTIGNVGGFALLLCLVNPYGLEGVAAACLVRSLCVQFALFVHMCNKQLITVKEYFGECILPWGYAAGLQALSLWLMSKYSSSEGIVPIITMGAISILPYTAGVFCVLSPEERVSLWHNLRKISALFQGSK